MVDRMTADQVSRVTGHKIRAVFDEYADHLIQQNLDEVQAVAAEVFANIVAFPGADRQMPAGRVIL
jgi:hypothetical protein